MERENMSCNTYNYKCITSDHLLIVNGWDQLQYMWVMKRLYFYQNQMETLGGKKIFYMHYNLRKIIIGKGIK